MPGNFKGDHELHECRDIGNFVKFVVILVIFEEIMGSSLSFRLSIGRVAEIAVSQYLDLYHSPAKFYAAFVAGYINIDNLPFDQPPCVQDLIDTTHRR